ncbi:hypothetical protein L7F22_055015 [Adiantum nelumboides]|nr:hypothetical protein [Adiantum nelumboides]
MGCFLQDYGSSPSDASSHIYMVQHLIEQCLLLRMSREECVAALAHHAHITPLVTSTVWNELQKMNEDFFRDYETRFTQGQSSHLL